MTLASPTNVSGPMRIATSGLTFTFWVHWRFMFMVVRYRVSASTRNQMVTSKGRPLFRLRCVSWQVCLAATRASCAVTPSMSVSFTRSVATTGSSPRGSKAGGSMNMKVAKGPEATIAYGQGAACGRRYDRRAPTVTRTHILVLSVAMALLGSVPLFRGDPKKFRQLYLRPDDILRSRPRFLGSQCDDKPPKEHSSPQPYDGDRNRLPHQYSDAERGDGATGNDQQECGGVGSALRPRSQLFPLQRGAGRGSARSSPGLIA